MGLRGEKEATSSSSLSLYSFIVIIIQIIKINFIS